MLSWKLSYDCVKILLNVPVWLGVTNTSFTAVGCSVLECVYPFFSLLQPPCFPLCAAGVHLDTCDIMTPSLKWILQSACICRVQLDVWKHFIKLHWSDSLSCSCGKIVMLSYKECRRVSPVLLLLMSSMCRGYSALMLAIKLQLTVIQNWQC